MLGFGASYIRDLTVITVEAAWSFMIHELLFNHTPSKVWGEITYPFPNFNGATVEVWEWMYYFIAHFMIGVITYPC